MKNWKTTLSGIGTAIMGVLTFLSTLPGELGGFSDVLPPDIKGKVTLAGAAATAAIHVIGAIHAKDASNS